MRTLAERRDILVGVRKESHVVFRTNNLALRNGAKAGNTLFEIVVPITIVHVPAGNYEIRTR